MEFGIKKDNCFALWDYIGGRYSLWSAIGLPIALGIGMDNFKKLLSGAEKMDNHFKTANFNDNLPVILALIGIWYRNFWDADTLAILPYADDLEYLPNYLQQLDMESNGKSINLAGEAIDYKTGPIIWGGIGTNGQHAFHQLLHQGNHLIPTDFILIENSNYPEYENHHSVLKSHCLAQIEALTNGRTINSEPHRNIPGNRPSNLISLEKLSPETLGSLIAMYEHKVFVQSVIWNINAFDQYGVELGKELSLKILKNL
jgi:glucose-6-phosphate isomerase